MQDRLDKYEQTLLEGWEDIHKRGQLTLWILLSLKQGPKHMNQIKEFIGRQTNDSLQADDKSMYRALRRFDDAEMISHISQPSKSGPDLKVYSLTDSGKQITEAFIERNISGIFYQPDVKKLIIDN